METIYTTGPICLDEVITVLGVYSDAHRWNGWLTPSIDAWSVEAVMAALQVDGYDQTPTHEWDENGDLVVIENDGAVTYRETLQADADGLYALGAYGWCWSKDSDDSLGVIA